ncbi:MAG TPA: choice-of-anchor Q domain-containing protein [Anaerolineae bacterium]|nr:choice-of-anchor Q domain-containing protein [Anaerolineae bacterium]
MRNRTGYGAFALLLALGALVLSLPAQADATITITTTSDSLSNDGQCSLREAIIAANTDQAFNGCATGNGADTLNLSPALPQPAVFLLTRSGAGEDGALTGDLDISGTLTLDGAGAAVIIDGNSADRVLQILPSARVTLSDVTLQHGNISGGGNGGGIAIDLTGVLTLTNSLVTSNTASSGGGVLVLGRLTLNGGAVANNQGGGIRNDGGSVVLKNAEIFGNTGGYGILNQNTANLSLEGGRVSGNQGGIYNSTSFATLSGASIISNTGGGGVVNLGTGMTRLTINHSAIMTNSAANGGGISNSGIGAVANIYDTRIGGNTATTAGGGVYNNGLMTLNGSTLDHNQARTGAGIDHSGGILHLTNDTFSGNQASDNGGGLYNRSDAILTNVTLQANTANGPDTGGNIFNDTAQLALRNSLVTGSEADGNCFNSGGSLNSSGYNLESADTCGLNATGDITNTNGLLGPLLDNGGPTFTHALLDGSPAIDAGSCTDAGGNPIPIDQRGFTRPQGAACDMGAFERSGHWCYLPLIAR